LMRSARFIAANRNFDCPGLRSRVSIPAELTTQRKTDSVAPLVERVCPVCESRAAAPHWRKGELRIVRCNDCGMVYANPVPASMVSGKFYDEAGADYYLSPAKLESDYADVRFERELQLFRKYCARGAVLDVGCSSGAFLFQLAKRWPGTYQTLGTDVSGAPLDYAESRGVPVVRGSFLEQYFESRDKPAPDPSSASACGSGATAPERSEGGPEGNNPSCAAPLLGGAGGGLGVTGKFDAVTFWAVLEHVAEPRRFLEKAHAVLKPDGLCFVLVPNLRSLAARWLGAKYRHVYEQHLNDFSAPSLTRLAEERFEIAATRFSHFNPFVIWQDWRGGGREVSNVERGALLKQTTADKQKAWLKPVKWVYGLAERSLAAGGLADNLVLVMRKREPLRGNPKMAGE